MHTVSASPVTGEELVPAATERSRAGGLPGRHSPDMAQGTRTILDLRDHGRVTL